MSTGNGPGPDSLRAPEQVHQHTEATLKQVMAAGDVARAMWRLLVAERSGQRMGEPERMARRVIDASRQRQEMALMHRLLADFEADGGLDHGRVSCGEA